MAQLQAPRETGVDEGVVGFDPRLVDVPESLKLVVGQTRGGVRLPRATGNLLRLEVAAERIAENAVFELRKCRSVCTSSDNRQK